MRNLLAGGATDVDRRDFSPARSCSRPAGMTVLITNYFDYFRLAAYIAERTNERIGIVMGVPSLVDLFDEKNHAQLPGGILESFGRLFKNDLKLYVYPPALGRRGAVHGGRHPGRARTPAALRLSGGRGSFVHLDNYRPEFLSIFSRDVLRRISAADDCGKPWSPQPSPSSSSAAASRLPPPGPRLTVAADDRA